MYFEGFGAPNYASCLILIIVELLPIKVCVLLGVSFSFVSICFMLFKIMFCIFVFNKNVKDSLYHAYFASIHVAVSK